MRPRPATHQRVVYVDESGDSETCLSLTALSLLDGVAEAQEQALETFCDEMAQMFGLPSDFELHGVELLKEARLKRYQREFLYRHALHQLAGIETLEVFTVHWDWSPEPARRRGDSPAWRLKLLYRRLLELLDESNISSGAELTAVTVDASSADDHVTDEHNDYVWQSKETSILAAPTFVDSKASRLLQLADLAAHAADLAARPHQGGKTNRQAEPQVAIPTRRSRRRRGGPPLPPAPAEPAQLVVGHDWYRDALGPSFASCEGRFGIRHLRGPDARPR